MIDLNDPFLIIFVYSVGLITYFKSVVNKTYCEGDLIVLKILSLCTTQVEFKITWILKHVTVMT